jgi:hypothetical protein
MNMIKKMLCMMLSALLIYGGIAVTAQAAVIGTGEALAMETRDARISDVERSLARDDVRQALIALGVDPVEAQGRLAGLSDAELAQVSTQLDALPAGGSLLALIGAVFVVLLILELVGVTNIFTHA